MREVIVLYQSQVRIIVATTALRWDGDGGGSGSK